MPKKLCGQKTVSIRNLGSLAEGVECIKQEEWKKYESTQYVVIHLGGNDVRIGQPITDVMDSFLELVRINNCI